MTCSVDIADHKGHINLHVSMLRHAIDSSPGVAQPFPAVIEDQEDLNTVEAILGHSLQDRIATGKGFKCIIKWEVNGPMPNSWSNIRLYF